MELHLEMCRSKDPKVTWKDSNILTTLTEPSLSWEANKSAARQEILRILWNSNVHYRIRNSPRTCPYPETDQAMPLLEYPV